MTVAVRATGCVQKERTHQQRVASGGGVKKVGVFVAQRLNLRSVEATETTYGANELSRPGGVFAGANSPYQASDS